MDRSRRRLLAASGTALAALAGCVSAPESNPSGSAPETPQTESPPPPPESTPTEAPSPAATPTATPVRADGDVVVRGEEWSLSPERIAVTAGQEVTVTFENDGSLAHNLIVGEFDVKTDTIQPGESDSITFTPDEPGEFPYWCDVAGHRDAGMEGTLVVEE